MAVVDPYSPCPCGSGQKFKWCCHKVESYADRSQRLYEGGQIGAALQTLEEGLKKEPGNAWLLSRKALILTRENRPGEAIETVRTVLKKDPRHAGALVLLTRLTLETEGPSAGAAQLQQALSAFPKKERGGLASLVRVVGMFLSETGDFPAALRHLFLSIQLSGGSDPDGAVGNTLRMITGSAQVSPWLKNVDTLSAPPVGLTGEPLKRFEEAITWAGEGLWSSAASAFETLTGDPIAGAVAERNLGFCRLWLADDAGAVAAFRRYTARIGPTEEAVDIEALCQEIAPPRDDEQVEQVRLSWPLRNKKGLLDALRADPAVHDEGVEPLDPDEDSPDVESFALLDRPETVRTVPLESGGKDLTLEQIPRVVGRVYVGEEHAILETVDDGRLDRLADRFTSIAGSNIPPAHPRTKVVGKIPRVRNVLTWEWILPEGIDPEHSRRLNRENGARLIRDVWPETPMDFLRGRTPLQAARAGDAVVPLRAAVFQLEVSREPWSEGFDFAALRERLHIPPEPELDPETVDPARIPLARLSLAPPERLSDQKLVALYLRARTTMSAPTLERAARVLIGRPEAIALIESGSLPVYTDLATLAAGRGAKDEARDWVRCGREADAPAQRARHAPQWDMLDLRLRTQSEKPESWVPDLAATLDRYRDDHEASHTLMLNLVDMGLLEIVPNPDKPGDILLDSRTLQSLLAQYGPRVTTASGRLGVSAAKPEIWTPGGQAGSQAGIWTPGSGAGATPPGEGGKKVIITGR